MFNRLEFRVVVIGHFNSLNEELQGKVKSITEVLDYQVRPTLCGKQIKHFKSLYFPHLKSVCLFILSGFKDVTSRFFCSRKVRRIMAGLAKSWNQICKRI